MKNFKRIEKEYEDFRNGVLSLSKEEIYNMSLKLISTVNIMNFSELQEYNLPNEDDLCRFI